MRPWATWTPLWVFFFLKKTHTRPYSLSGRVKFGPLGSSRAGYMRVGFKLPSLPLVLIFQLFKILEQRILTPLSLNPDSVPNSRIVNSLEVQRHCRPLGMAATTT